MTEDDLLNIRDLNQITDFDIMHLLVQNKNTYGTKLSLKLERLTDVTKKNDEYLSKILNNFITVFPNNIYKNNLVKNFLAKYSNNVERYKMFSEILGNKYYLLEKDIFYKLNANYDLLFEFFKIMNFDKKDSNVIKYINIDFRRMSEILLYSDKYKSFFENKLNELFCNFIIPNDKFLKEIKLSGNCNFIYHDISEILTVMKSIKNVDSLFKLINTYFPRMFLYFDENLNEDQLFEFVSIVVENFKIHYSKSKILAYSKEKLLINTLFLIFMNDVNFFEKFKNTAGDKNVFDIIISEIFKINDREGHNAIYYLLKYGHYDFKVFRYIVDTYGIQRYYAFDINEILSNKYIDEHDKESIKMYMDFLM